MRVLLFFCSFLLISCALPNEDLRQGGAFVPKQEQLAIKIVREGSDYFLKGRYFEAEMKFRQANYLFPERKNIKINLINTLIRSGQFDLAKKDLSSLQKFFAEDIDVVILQAKYDQALGNYEEAIQSYQHSLQLSRTFELVEYQATIAENLSAIYFLIGEEDQALSYIGQSFHVLNKPETKAKYARLQVGIGLDRFSEDLSTKGNRLNKADQDFLTWQLLMTQILQSEQSLNLISQIRLFNGENASFSPDLEYLEIVNKDLKIEDERVESQEKLKTHIMPILWRTGQLKPEVRLYWPINLIYRLQETCQELSEEGDEGGCQII